MASALALILADHEGPWEWSRVRPALVVALLILGSFFIDAIDRMMTLHFEVARLLR